MDLKKLINVNVRGSYAIPTPEEVQKRISASDKALKIVLKAREEVRKILSGQDSRLFIVVGPCSIHDEKSALEYAARLKALSDRVSDTMLLLMRAYFEKPRTTVGWKGFINDPRLDDSFHIEEGIERARKLLCQMTEMGVPAATEALDPITPQYISELISWSAIGARTTESQTHREIASGLSMPVGFKNGTDGNIQVALNAMKSSLTPHHFLGIDSQGRISVFMTKGNADCHIVLRGGERVPNYDQKSVHDCEAALKVAGLNPRLMIDCSHGNSNKDHKNQPKVFREVIRQVLEGDSAIVGVMIESHLHEGAQKLPKDLSQLKYGVSITDACLSWEDTETMILEAHKHFL